MHHHAGQKGAHSETYVMKTQIKPMIWFLSLLASLSAPHLASAYYDPGVQRWINRDPIGERGGLNLYKFTANSPVNDLDPQGLSLTDENTNRSDKPGLGCAPLCNLAVGANTRLQMIMNRINYNDPWSGGNAFQHCVNACRASKLCGAAAAKRFWDDREDPQAADGRMDLENNRVGYAVASQASCWEVCMKSWKEGGLSCMRGPCPPPPRPKPPVEMPPNWPPGI